MKIKIYEFIQICTIEGFEQKTRLFTSKELAKKYYNDAVEADERDVKASARTRSQQVLYLDDPEYCNKVEEGDFVIEKEENEYMSYNYGCLGDGFVSVSFKEHELEV